MLKPSMKYYLKMTAYNVPVMNHSEKKAIIKLKGIINTVCFGKLQKLLNLA